jgi:DNA helicase HerA-like ATPase
MRNEIVDRLVVPLQVWSMSGRDVQILAPFDTDLDVGGFIVVTPPSGVQLLAQITELQMGEREGATVALDGNEIGPIAGEAHLVANVTLMLRFITGFGRVLGELGADRLGPAPTVGFPEGELRMATADEVSRVLHQGLGDQAGLTVGTTCDGEVSVVLKASGFARHTFMVGQSGSGKTYTLGVLLERLLLNTTLPIVILDPNGDYVHLGELSPRDRIAPRGRPPISHRAHRDLKSAMRAAGEVGVASARSHSLPLRFHLSDLSLGEQALTMGLDPLRDSDEFAAFSDAVDALAGHDRYGFDAVLSQLQRADDEWSSRLKRRINNLRVADWSVWARSDEPSFISRIYDKRAIVLDTGSLADARERSVVALAVMGFFRRREARRAFLLVFDEAHNFFDPQPDDELQRAAVDYGVWIAGEGRKYGLHMVVSTQRPQKIHRNIISQCDNLLLMRMNSKADIAELSSIFSFVPSAMINEARLFAQGEFLVAGPIATPPLRVATGPRWCPEGGADLPTTWTMPRTEQRS